MQQDQGSEAQAAKNRQALQVHDYVLGGLDTLPIGIEKLIGIFGGRDSSRTAQDRYIVGLASLHNEAHMHILTERRFSRNSGWSNNC